MEKKYRIYIVESERKWGHRHWHRYASRHSEFDFDTYEEACSAIKSINAVQAPDWYIQAEDRVEVVEV